MRHCLPRIGAFGFVAAFLLVNLATAAETTKNSTRPNIILLLADDLGWTGLRCFGSDLYETPNLDALADRGVKFTNAYAACTVCSPTRASIMTGQYPARLHLTDFIAGQDRPYAMMRIPDWTKGLASEHTTIAEVLKGSGYRTAHIGKWHLNFPGAAAKGSQPTDQGFDMSYDKPPGTKGYFLKEGTQSESGSNFLTDALTDKACEFIDESRSEPFFLYFAYHVPHTPIQGRGDLVDYFKQKVDPNALHTNPTYAAMVASLDQSVGRIVERLAKHELTDNTVIIFTSDNGGLTERHGKHDGYTENLPLRRGKGSAYEGGVRVPAIVDWPGVTKPGTVCDEPIMTIDLFPTLQEIAGIKTTEPPVCDGVNITPLLRDVSVHIDRDLFWHYPHYHAGGDGPYSAIRSGHFRLLEFHEDDSVRLYDLSTDIGEQQDLSKELTEKTAELRTKLHRWRESINAQMPSPNPNYDPDREMQVGENGRRQDPE